MGACTSNKRDKTIKPNEITMEKSVILDYYMNDTKNNIRSTQNKKKSNNSHSQITNNSDSNSNSNKLKNRKKDDSTNYYLICPDCSIRSPHIEKLYYDNNSKDFLVKYTCMCNNNFIVKEIPLINILSNKEPLNECDIHLNNKLVNYCKTCKRAICSQCQQEKHTNHDLEIDVINRPISKEDAHELLEKIKEKEELFNIEINKSEEKVQNGIDNKIQQLTDEKINYKKQLENYKENNLKTFSFLKNLYSRYINNFNNGSDSNHNINNEFNNNDIMLTNHIHNFAIKSNDITKFNTNIDEIINQYNDEKKELKINYDYGFENNNNISIEEYKNKNIKNSNNILNSQISNNKNNNINIEYGIKKKEFECIKTLKGHSEKIVSLIELSSGKLISGSYDNSMRIWDINNNTQDKIINENGKVFCILEFEKNKILIGTSENCINLWDINYNNDKCIFSFTGHDLWVNALVKCNNNYFASGSNDSNIKIWDYYNRICKSTLKGHVDCILSLIILKNNNLCSGSADLTLRIWDWKSSECLSILKGHVKWVKCVLELDNGIIITGSDDKTIKLWKNYINIETLEGHKHSVRTFCQINEKFFASGSFDSTIKIWEINSWKCVQTLYGHESNIICLINLNSRISNNNIIASCSNDKTIKIWEGNP